MAFAGKKASEGGVRKLYTGFAKLKPVMVNPNKDELSAFYGGADIEKEPVYVGKDQDGKSQCRITIFLEDTEDLGIKTSVTYYIVKKYQEAESGKVRVINQYGQNTWVDPEHVENGTVPDNMAWFSTEGMRKAAVGEPELIDVLKNIANITGLQKATEKGDLSAAECMFENVNKVIDGDVSEIKTIIEEFGNTVGFMLGVKSTDDGKNYQYVYPRKTIRGFFDDFSPIVEEIEASQERGAMNNINFGYHPYNLEEFSEDSTDEAPTAGSSSGGGVPDEPDF